MILLFVVVNGTTGNKVNTFGTDHPRFSFSKSTYNCFWSHLQSGCSVHTLFISLSLFHRWGPSQEDEKMGKHKHLYWYLVVTLPGIISTWFAFYGTTKSYCFGKHLNTKLSYVKSSGEATVAMLSLVLRGFCAIYLVTIAYRGRGTATWEDWWLFENSLREILLYAIVN